MAGGSPADDAARRRALRRLARTHHPDLGGDPETYVRLAAALESRSAHARGGEQVAPVRVRPAARWRLVLRRLRRRSRRWAAERRRERRRRTDLGLASRRPG